MFRKLLFTLSFILAGLATASAQLVVEAKPEAPQQQKTLKAPADETYVLVPAEWTDKKGAYAYVQPRYVKQRPGFKYVPGKWKKVSGGWMWKVAAWKAK